MKSKNLLLAAAAAGAALALPTAAQAQDLPGEGFIGVQAGVHDLGLDDIENDFAVEVDDSGTILGAFAGYDLPLGPGAFVGAEVNYNIGFGAVDSELGIAGRIGARLPGGAKVYARGGYQHVDLDIEEILDADLGGEFDGDDGDGDYIVGLGADFPLGKTFVRVNLDTIQFDTVRATAGVGVKF